MRAASPSVTMYGTPTCSDCLRSRRLLDRLEIPYSWVDIAADANAAEYVRTASGRTSTPYIELPDGSTLVEPSDDALTDALRRTGVIS